MYTFPAQVWDELADEFNLRHDYSGRGMFGARCIGLTGRVGDLLRFVVACQRTADEFDLPTDDLIDELAGAVRSDNMGHDQIFYFPGVTLDDHSDTSSRDHGTTS